MRLGMNPEINAMGTLIMGLVGLVVVGNSYYLMKRERSQAHSMRNALQTAPTTRNTGTWV
jgi:Co/Zn/Cd efflux system component